MAKPASRSADMFDVRNAFVLGNYQGAINAAHSITKALSAADAEERDAYVYRSYVAQKKYDLVLHDINDSKPVSLQAVRLLAIYFSKDKEQALNSIKQLLDGSGGANRVVQIVAAMLYLNEERYEEAMRAVFQQDSLEAHSILVNVYLHIRRFDQAEKELKAMQKLDEDATLTQVTNAHFSIASGPEKADEGAAIFLELSEKYGATPLLLNGLAAAAMAQGQWAEAEKHLLEALERNTSDVDTLINLAAVMQNQGKPQDQIARQITQIRSIAPQHPYLKNYDRLREDFKGFSQGWAKAAK